MSSRATHHLLSVSLLILLGSSPIFSLSSESIQTVSGVTIELEYRALQPGEIVLVSLKENPLANEAVVEFLDRTHTLGLSSGKCAFVLVGLDLGLKPGLYRLSAEVKKKDGTTESIQKEIAVSAKEFPVKKLWVDQDYVTPPPETQERIQREVELLRAVYSMPLPGWLGEGGFVMPCAGTEVPNFGERRIYNTIPRSSHSGIDVSAPSGAPVRASNSGKVVLASDLYFSGKTVLIDHGLGVFTLYCHLSKISVKRGQMTGKGELIGEVGATGRVTGPHLHWGVRIYRSRVDPYALLSLSLD